MPVSLASGPEVYWRLACKEAMPEDQSLADWTICWRESTASSDSEFDALPLLSLHLPGQLLAFCLLMHQSRTKVTDLGYPQPLQAAPQGIQKLPRTHPSTNRRFSVKYLQKSLNPRRTVCSFLVRSTRSTLIAPRPLLIPGKSERQEPESIPYNRSYPRVHIHNPRPIAYNTPLPTQPPQRLTYAAIDIDKDRFRVLRTKSPQVAGQSAPSFLQG